MSHVPLSGCASAVAGPATVLKPKAIAAVKSPATPNFRKLSASIERVIASSVSVGLMN
jgi:hypothetical protein